jgi:hypothetical protein
VLALIKIHQLLYKMISNKNNLFKALMQLMFLNTFITYLICLIFRIN